MKTLNISYEKSNKKGGMIVNFDQNLYATLHLDDYTLGTALVLPEITVLISYLSHF